MTSYPSIFTGFPNLVAAQSNRGGGISPKPFDALNLSFETDDTIENVSENRRRFFDKLGISKSEVASCLQVHKDLILKVDYPGRYSEYDALITDQAKVFLAISAADCTPILIYDSKQEAVAAIHAGWKGTVKRIAEKALRKMELEFGTRPEGCFAYVGTCIDRCDFLHMIEQPDSILLFHYNKHKH